ncbi:LytR family transcriptional attenuator [Microbacterium sp. AG1240]|uniref:LCP family protein n=1 Tax=Microbacterium sp. AG1240 TaxID=2183992 RepID=UPI000EB12132|nr:LCP family protein [Microbacterium sp. AG1240]RKT35558.1 LytR family transcriptional attenuator [Microbacterium sp. AG1240]
MGTARRGTRRTTVARHGRLTSPRAAMQLLTLLGVAASVMVVSLVAVSSFTLFSSVAAVADKAIVLEGDPAAPPAIGAIEGGTNVLLVGTDSCEGQDLATFARCGIDDDGLERNDVTILVNISDNPRRVTVVSFPRDMLVGIPSCPDGDGGRHPAMSQMPMNASYVYGGLACTALTVEELTGGDVQFAAAIRWTGVIAMSDAIGGVDVCVAGDISDPHTGLQLTAGDHTLQGTQALQFLRIRHGIGDGSDLGRISNQQQFMSSLVRRMQSDETFTNPAILIDLATTALRQVNQGQLVLDQNLANPTLMVQLAMALKGVPQNDIVFVQYPTRYAPGATPDNNLVLPVDTAGDALFAAIAANEPLELTGAPSQGYGVEVVEPAPDEPPAVEGDPPPSDEPAVDATAVPLPSQIAGTTAEQVTCTVPEGRF